MQVIKKLKDFRTLELLQKANELTLKNHSNEITLERAIFLSWWCEKGDCAFCYMSTQKPRISDPKKARRQINSILAEAELCRRMGWNIEFLSGGYGSFSTSEIKSISQDIFKITKQPVWLNIGITNDLEEYGEEISGITGAIEIANPELHDKICPSKSLEDITNMLEVAGDLGFKKAITIILGLGETPDDLEYLFNLINDLKIHRVTFYSLNPHKDTIFETQPQPASLYYAGVVAATRIMFPELEIVCGTWIDNLANIGPLIMSGANGLTKFPLFKMFGTRYGKRVEEEVYWSGRKLKGTFTDFNSLKNGADLGELNPFIKRYIDKCLNKKPLKE
ncbi:radical SAM protein [Methanobacterium alcaliphilum]|uniref:radical SAM protein n=1 Tax=Methanobacterium alcaliphilum TaxID=392018 RepID=UPI00200B7E8F|nr:radical SAM protein [Methanobacterium alcaliphilum]MCK9151413.1 radical SAM protein [Methanobacterium alcaliphilum]